MGPDLAALLSPGRRPMSLPGGQSSLTPAFSACSWGFSWPPEGALPCCGSCPLLVARLVGQERSLSSQNSVPGCHSLCQLPAMRW